MTVDFSIPDFLESQGRLRRSGRGGWLVYRDEGDGPDGKATAPAPQPPQQEQQQQQSQSGSRRSHSGQPSRGKGKAAVRMGGGDTSRRSKGPQRNARRQGGGTLTLEDEDDDEGEDDVEGASSSSENDDEEAVDDDDAQQQPKQPEAPAVPTSIQILDLHSDHPLFSYRGRLFEGTWAENLGTELIFAPGAGGPIDSATMDTRAGEGDEEDEEEEGQGSSKEDAASASMEPLDPRIDPYFSASKAPPLPALRHLGAGVDLLAASAARITAKEVRAVPRRAEQQRRQTGPAPAASAATAAGARGEQIDEGNTSKKRTVAAVEEEARERHETDETTRRGQGPMDTAAHLSSGAHLASTPDVDGLDAGTEPAQIHDFAELRRQYGTVIPVSSGVSDERRTQSRFLENLIAIKKRRGDRDEVTVLARPGARGDGVVEEEGEGEEEGNVEGEEEESDEGDGPRDGTRSRSGGSISRGGLG